MRASSPLQFPADCFGIKHMLSVCVSGTQNALIIIMFFLCLNNNHHQIVTAATTNKIAMYPSYARTNTPICAKWLNFSIILNLITHPRIETNSFFQHLTHPHKWDRRTSIIVECMYARMLGSLSTYYFQNHHPCFEIPTQSPVSSHRPTTPAPKI